MENKNSEFLYVTFLIIFMYQIIFTKIISKKIFFYEQKFFMIKGNKVNRLIFLLE